MAQKESRDWGGKEGDENGTVDEAQQNIQAPEEQPPILNEANDIQEQCQVFPLPGWTESSQRVQQCTTNMATNPPPTQPQLILLPGWTVRGHRVVRCTERGGPHWPIGGIAISPPPPPPPPRQPPPQLFSLLGWTVRGLRVVQCTERGGPHWPFGGIAVIPPFIGREPQENACNCNSCRNNNLF